MTENTCPPGARRWPPWLFRAACRGTGGGPGPRLSSAWASIRFVVPYPPGGRTDILARAVAQKLSETWKVPVVVDNKPGGGGTIGAQLVANSPADGQTVLFTIVALVQQIAMMKLPYDPLKDFVPVTRVAISPSILAVPKDTPVNDAKEFIALVKSQPGRFNYGTYGVGTSSHIQGSLLNLQGGLDMVHVPYQGAAPLINAMLGNQLSSAFLDAGSSRQHLPKFKLLGTTGTQRAVMAARRADAQGAGTGRVRADGMVRPVAAGRARRRQW